MIENTISANNTLDAVVRSAVSAVDLSFVGTEFSGSGGTRVFRVYVESTDGVLNANLLARVSRQISAVLDVEPLIPGSYILEVSSPGAERPLFSLEDYARFLGKQVQIKLRAKQEGARQYTVTLHSVEEKDIVAVLDSGVEITFDFDNIARAHLVPSWQI